MTSDNNLVSYETGEISAAFMYKQMIKRATGHSVHVRLSDLALLCVFTAKRVGSIAISDDLNLHYTFLPTEEMIKESNV